MAHLCLPVHQFQLCWASYILNFSKSQKQTFFYREMIQIVIFVCFLEELRTPEFAFKIYWPLVKDMKNNFLISFKSFRRFECLIWRLSLEWTLGTHLCSSANRNKCHSLWQEVGDDKPCFIDRWWNLSGRGHLARVLFRRAQWGILIFLKKIHCTM